MIPRRLHLWWHERPLPDHVVGAVRTWRAVHPGWSVRCWSDETDLAPAFADARRADVDDRDRIRHTANVVRWHLLAAHGGVWVDVDTTPLAPLDPILEESSDPFVPVAGLRPTPFVIGGPAGHTLWTAAARASTTGTGTSPWVSGGPMLERLVAQRLDVRRYPLECFTATDARGNPLPLPADGIRYSDHAWTTSRARHREREARA